LAYVKPGKTRDQIAYEVHIGAGTVSGIVRGYRKDDPESDLLREVALNLKTRGLDIQSFAPLITLREVLDEKGWLPDVKQVETKEEEHGDLDQVVEKKMESFIIRSKCFALNKTYR
jgi:hypothetical protein